MGKSRQKRLAKRRRPTIGDDPLDMLLSFTPPGGEPAVGEAQRSARPPTRSSSRKPLKVRATFHLPHDLFEQCRDAVVFLSGPPSRLTLAALAERGLERELSRLKKEHNRGRKFPPRDSDLKGGRPIGS